MFFTKTANDEASLTSEMDSIYRAIDDINTQIEQISRATEHRTYIREDSLRQLELAGARLRSAKEKPIESDSQREVDRLETLRRLEAELSQREQETPAALTRLAESAQDDDKRRVQLHAKISEHQARLAELSPQLRALREEREAKHRLAGEACYDQLLQSFNELAMQERELALALAEKKSALLNKSEEAARALGSGWPMLARKFSDETAHTLRISQQEVIDSSAESLKLARARRGGMLID